MSEYTKEEDLPFLVKRPFQTEMKKEDASKPVDSDEESAVEEGVSKKKIIET